MGAIGTRPTIKKKPEEPTLWAEVEHVIKDLENGGFIDNQKVNIEKIILSKGIKIQYDENLEPSKSGYLRKINEEWVIGVNKKHNRKRQRFTLAHEFGHFILHKNEDTVFEDEILYRDENLTSIEYAANRFAAELLMPKEIFISNIEKGKTSLDDLAEKFDVSVLAVKNRVLTLGYNLRNEK